MMYEQYDMDAEINKQMDGWTYGWIRVQYLMSRTPRPISGFIKNYLFKKDFFVIIL